MSTSIIERSVDYITNGIIFLSTTLPDSDTFGIPEELCENATPGDLLTIAMEGNQVVSAEVKEVRDHRDTSGHI